MYSVLISIIYPIMTVIQMLNFVKSILVLIRFAEISSIRMIFSVMNWEPFQSFCSYVLLKMSVNRH